jgi:hypothetical protein
MNHYQFIPTPVFHEDYTGIASVGVLRPFPEREK